MEYDHDDSFPFDFEPKGIQINNRFLLFEIVSNKKVQNIIYRVQSSKLQITDEKYIKYILHELLAIYHWVQRVSRMKKKLYHVIKFSRIYILRHLCLMAFNFNINIKSGIVFISRPRGGPDNSVLGQFGPGQMGVFVFVSFFLCDS